jgi:hypothetical protein
MYKIKKSVNDFLIKYSFLPYKVISLKTKIKVKHYKKGLLRIKNL